MSSQSSETEELKNLTRHQLASVTWPTRISKDSSYVTEFQDHIRRKFNEANSSSNRDHTYGREINEFTTLRNIAISSLAENAIRDVDSLKALKKYYCQLASMFNRFKECDAKFEWKDSLGRGVTEGDIAFEINNIMYNIAAIHNELGSKIARINEAATKEACSHYSNALWWITELRDSRGGRKPKEMSRDLLTFYHHILKAQAQECVLSHSLRSGMRPNLLAKISAQIAGDYDVATKAQAPLYTDPIKEMLTGSSNFHSWRSTVYFKHKYYSAITQMLLGFANSDDSAKEIGQRIARLEAARLHVESVKKSMVDVIDSQTAREALDVLEKLIKSKLEKAIRYNDNVYHSAIPSSETLPIVEGQLLISPAPFSISSIPEFQDLFSSLVTIETVQVNSIYSQKKDELSRNLKKSISEQDEALAHMLSKLNISRGSLNLPSLDTPDELVEICAELSMNPNIVDDVLTELEDLDDKSEEIQKLLDHVQQMLNQRPHQQYQEELKRFRATHEDALRTTQSLHKQLYPELQKNIQLLSTTSDPLELMPKDLSVASISVNERTVIKKLEKLLDKVDEMKQQRATLLAQLNQSLDQDDVIKHVVAAASEQELKSVFEKEIQKHNKYVNPLKSNLSLQDEIVHDIEEVYTKYGDIKLKHREKRARLAEKVDSYKKFHLQFKSLMEGIRNGLDYNNKMLDFVRKFHSKVQATYDLNDLLN